MPWQLIKLEADARSAERLADALLEVGALSVSMEDARAGTADEQPVFGEPGMAAELWATSIVAALFPGDTAVEPVLRAAAAMADLPGLPPHRIEPLEEQDWVRATQSQFEPIRISPRLWIVPSWHTAPDPQAINLLLDPGLAFGTGSHPTTRLCLRWLEAALPAGATFLDYGCGSGILAIAAKKLGAGAVEGIDIDPQAVEAARRNAAANGVEARFCLPDAASDAEYDVVMANILSNPLKVLAPALAARTRRGGRIVLSGVLAHQADEVAACYRTWFDMASPGFDEGWALLTGTRR